ncbi:MAG: DNA polymerase III subunit delta [Flavobacteriia bacterium]|jgi:DNA polymerase-3 subunit delta|nr:DNA polymerase III subunit delta [Cryomorphaceae bacterium]
MDYLQLIKEIRSGQFRKIYFLHGEEPFFIDEISNAIIHGALQEHERDFNQTIIYGKDAEPASLIAELNGYPMMAERRLVVLREAQDFDKKIEELEPYFNSPLESTIFVVGYKYKNFDSRKKLIKLAEKQGVVFKSEKVKEYSLGDWIVKYVKSKGYGLSSKACSLLAEFLGNDLGRIVNEIEKLAIILEPGTTINEVHIEENIGISKDYNVFELTNALSARDVFKANRIVNYFEQNPKATNIVVVIPQIFKLFTQLLRIHFLPNKSPEGVASALKVPPFVAKELINASKQFDPRKIAANIAVLQEYDLKSKGVGNSSSSHGDLMRELIFRMLH